MFGKTGVFCDGFMLIFEGHAGTGPENRLG
jgi:hypothetical protein